MAKCFPPHESVTDAPSSELRVFQALASQLIDDYVILHSVCWVAKQSGSDAQDGELDFLILHPNRGLLALEIKGGRIDCDYRQGSWHSTDRNGNRHKIKNPFDQAKRSKFSILNKIKEDPRWHKLGIKRFNIGHAVLFPDVGNSDQLSGPDAPDTLLGDQRDLESISAWVEGVFAYWSDGEGLDPIKPSGVDFLVSLFARTGTTRSLVSARIEEDATRQIELTNRQAFALDMLRRHRRAIISGGAGTGKTLLALERAKRSAREGFATLLLCYNRGLADHLRELSKDTDGLDIATFHQVCTRWCGIVQKKSGKDLIALAQAETGSRDLFDRVLPTALTHAIDELGPAYDAIVVDEAQDFGDEFWFPVEMLLNDYENGLLYVFLDENQDIYRRPSTLPIEGEPLVLDRNCRNTDRIHEIAYQHYVGTPVIPPGIDGLPVEALTADTLAKQAVMVGNLITQLIAREDVQPEQIAVLLCNSQLREKCEAELTKQPIPKTVQLGRIEAYKKGVVTIDSVARFKGLEREIVILWAFDPVSSTDRETFYVGMSRAKSALYLCGSKESCQKLKHQAQESRL